MPRVKVSKPKSVKSVIAKSNQPKEYSSSRVKRSREVSAENIINSKVSSRTNVTKIKTNRQARTTAKRSSLSVPVFDSSGRSQGTVILPKEIFGQEPNMDLLSQAFRIYFANQRTHTASTKTRAEVRGGGKKPWRQKGTGRARAGSTRSPLWVGGGITFGPRPRKVKLTLPEKMRKKALTSALSLINKNGSLFIISNFEKLPAKTKVAANLLSKLELSGKTLLVLSTPSTNVKLATRNIPETSVDTVENLNAFKILTINNLLLEKGAIEKLKA